MHGMRRCLINVMALTLRCITSGSGQARFLQMHVHVWVHKLVHVRHQLGPLKM